MQLNSGKKIICLYYSIDSFIKDAKKRKKSAEWKEWKTSMDNYRYKQWSKFGEK